VTDEQIKDAILNAVRSSIETYHLFSRGMSSDDPEQVKLDAAWLGLKCEEVAKKAIEGR